MPPTRDPAEFPKHPLTSGGKQRPAYANDAPPALQALALTQVPRAMRGPAQRGAYARGWCDAVRGRKATHNPYQRGGSGWQHGMAGLYADGWRAGKVVLYVDSDESKNLTERQYNTTAELRERVMAILRGEIVSPKRAVARRKP